MNPNEPILGMTTKIQADAQIAEIQSRRGRGISWFYWVAGLSVINSVIVLSGGNWSFIFGLGFTQVIDAIAVSGTSLTEGRSTIVGFVGTLVVAGALALVGYAAQRGHQAIFVLGISLYALDALIFAVVRDFLALGFHMLALIGMTRGLLAQRELLRLEAAREATGA